MIARVVPKEVCEKSAGSTPTSQSFGLPRRAGQQLLNLLFAIHACTDLRSPFDRVLVVSLLARLQLESTLVPKRYQYCHRATQLRSLFITCNLLGAYTMSPIMCPNCSVSIGMETYGPHSYPPLPANALNSNNGMELSSHMRSQYSKTIAGIETDISQLDEEMSRLQTIVSRLATERQRLERSLEEHRSIAAPIGRIPLDVLSEIFIFCADSSD